MSVSDECTYNACKQNSICSPRSFSHTFTTLSLLPILSYQSDEYGRPFIILKEQQAKARVKGMEATKSNILAARSISSLLRTSLGPKGLDKMLVSPDGGKSFRSFLVIVGPTSLCKALHPCLHFCRLRFTLHFSFSLFFRCHHHERWRDDSAATSSRPSSCSSHG